MKIDRSVFAEDSNYALFVGNKFLYYKHKWVKLIKRRKNHTISDFRKLRIFKDISFNLSALLSGVLWFWYRKMFLFGSIILIVQILLHCLASTLPSNLCVFIDAFIFVVPSLYANKLYFIHVTNNLSKIVHGVGSGGSVSAKIMSKGGVSVLSSMIFFFMWAFTIGFFAFIIDSFLPSHDKNSSDLKDMFTLLKQAKNGDLSIDDERIDRLLSKASQKNIDQLDK